MSRSLPGSPNPSSSDNRNSDRFISDPALPDSIHLGAASTSLPERESGDASFFTASPADNEHLSSVGEGTLEDEVEQQIPSAESGGRIPRQVTFGVAVQTDFPLYERRDVTGGQQNPDAPSSSAAASSRLERFVGRRAPRWLDCTSLCYLSIAVLMISVGLIITIVTVEEKAIDVEPTSEPDGVLRVVDANCLCYLLCGSLLVFVGVGISILISNEKHKSNAAQLWIVGPIFLCSGILVCIKAGTHIYKRLHPTPQRQRDAFGNFLVPDSRASLARPASIPPSYSRALAAPLPSTVQVVDEDDKPFETQSRGGGETESLALVTINFDPPPPSYEEAIEYFQRKSVSDIRPRSRSDFAERRSRTSDHSAQFPSPPLSRSVSQTNTTALEALQEH